jgi:hypothetical protein
MAVDSTTPRTRRAVLAGGIATAAAALLGRPQPASAHDPDDVRLGADNSAASVTTVTNTASNAWAFQAVATSGIGVYGDSGSGAGAVGVFGASSSGYGVYGDSTSGNGITGHTSSSGASGVYGENRHEGYGVAGRSNSRPLGTGGVFAAATLGDNTANGVGVWARSTHGIGLYADAVEADAVALQANGVTQFRRSGKLTVLAGHSSVSKTGIRIDPRSLVLAVLQEDRPGIHVRSAVPNPAGDSFTVRLNTAVATDTKVGWFVVN